MSIFYHWDIEVKKAALLVIAHDVDPVELVFIPAARWAVSSVIINDKARLGTEVLLWPLSLLSKKCNNFKDFDRSKVTNYKIKSGRPQVPPNEKNRTWWSSSDR